MNIPKTSSQRDIAPSDFRAEDGGILQDINPEMTSGDIPENMKTSWEEEKQTRLRQDIWNIWHDITESIFASEKYRDVPEETKKLVDTIIDHIDILCETSLNSNTSLNWLIEAQTKVDKYQVFLQTLLRRKVGLAHLIEAFAHEFFHDPEYITYESEILGKPKEETIKNITLYFTEIQMFCTENWKDAWVSRAQEVFSQKIKNLFDLILTWDENLLRFREIESMFSGIYHERIVQYRRIIKGREASKNPLEIIAKNILWTYFPDVIDISGVIHEPPHGMIWPDIMPDDIRDIVGKTLSKAKKTRTRK